jgi:hypothetical protein
MQKTANINILVLVLLILLTLSSVGYTAYSYFKEESDEVTQIDESKTEEIPTEEANSDWQTYTSEYYKISIKYPSSWDKSEDQDSLTISAPTDKSTYADYLRVIKVSAGEKTLFDYIMETDSSINTLSQEDENLNPIFVYNLTSKWDQEAYMYYSYTGEDTNRFGYIVKVGNDIYDISYSLTRDNSEILETIEFEAN